MGSTDLTGEYAFLAQDSLFFLFFFFFLFWFFQCFFFLFLVQIKDGNWGLQEVREGNCQGCKFEGISSPVLRASLTINNSSTATSATTKTLPRSARSAISHCIGGRWHPVSKISAPTAQILERRGGF